MLCINNADSVALAVHKQAIIFSRLKRNHVVSTKTFSSPCNLHLAAFLSATQAVVAGSSAFLVNLDHGAIGRFEVEKITCVARLTSELVLFGTSTGVFLFSIANLVDPVRAFDRVAVVSLVAISDNTFLASTGNQIRLYSVEQRNALQTLRTAAVFSLARVPRTATVSSCDAQGVMHFWDERKLVQTYKPLSLPEGCKPDTVSWSEIKKFTVAVSDSAFVTMCVLHESNDELTVDVSERFESSAAALAFRHDALFGNVNGEICSIPFARKSCLSFSDRGLLSFTMAGSAAELEIPCRDISMVMRKRLDAAKPQITDERKRDLFVALGLGESGQALAALAELGTTVGTEITCAVASLAIRSSAPQVWYATLHGLRSSAAQTREPSSLAKEILFALELLEEDEVTRFTSLVSALEISVKVRWWVASATGRGRDFQEHVAEHVAGAGHLDGLELVADSSLGVDGVRKLLQEFLLRTSDVQSLTDIAMRTARSDKEDAISTVLKESFFRRAIRSYLELLSRWRRWKERTRICKALFPDSSAVAILRCYFCDYPLTGNSRGAQQNRCPNELCHKALPKCSVCLSSVFAGGKLRVWTAWCAKCKHGGHQQHLLQWFKEFDECPVSGCRCECARLDGGL